MIEQLEHDLASKCDNVFKLEQQVANDLKTIESFKNQIDELTEHNLQQSKECQNNLRMKQSLEHEVEQLASAKADLQQKFSETEKTRRVLTKQLDVIKRGYDKLAEKTEKDAEQDQHSRLKITKANEDILSLTGKLAAQMETNALLKNDIAAEKDHVNRLYAEVAQLRESQAREKADGATELASALGKIADLEARIHQVLIPFLFVILPTMVHMRLYVRSS